MKVAVCFLNAVVLKCIFKKLFLNGLNVIKQLNVTAFCIWFYQTLCQFLCSFPPLAWKRSWVFASSYVLRDQRLSDQPRTQGPLCHPTSLLSRGVGNNRVSTCFEEIRKMFPEKHKRLGLGEG